MSVKTCTRCGETKPLDQFPPIRRSEPDKRQGWCRACFSNANRRNYWKDPESVRSRVGRNSSRRRADSQRRAIEYLVAHPCVDCGEQDIVCLQFDHLMDKKFDVSVMISTGVSWTRIAAEIGKCEVRCANCHARKTARERGYRKLAATPSLMPTTTAPLRPVVQLELGTGATIMCRVCGLSKANTEFALRSKATGKRHHICRSCRSLYNREWWAKNRVVQMPRIKLSRQMRYREIEQRIWDHLFMPPGVDCGQADVAVLHFDHLRDKVNEISTMFRRQRSWKAVLEEIAKCEVRCANCHARKTAREQGNYKLRAS
jgi:hypothetical protein